MRVFISSTCYDLIDLRAELAVHLKGMGLTPVLSDDKLSDFKVQHDVHSIETCLVNVESCESMIIILDRRYGPTLEAFGYPEVSATHLEYQKAVEIGIPIHFFVRDRLEADYSFWKRNVRNEDVKLTWARDSRGLLKLIDEHKNHQPGEGRSNWYSTFTHSVDLRAAVSSQFEADVLPLLLKQAIENNKLPLFQIHVDEDVTYRVVANDRNVKHFSADLVVRNLLGNPAHDFQLFDVDTNQLISAQRVFVPGMESPFTDYGQVHSSESVERKFRIEYSTTFGIRVSEFHFVTYTSETHSIRVQFRLDDREFHRFAPIEVKIF